MPLARILSGLRPTPPPSCPRSSSCGAPCTARPRSASTCPRPSSWCSTRSRRSASRSRTGTGPQLGRRGAARRAARARRSCCAGTWTRCPSPRTPASRSPPSAPGVMHACGHDLHVAGLVGAARLLAARRDEIAGDVVLMFQPGEEGDHGARLMIEEGVLDAAGSRVVAAYGAARAVVDAARRAGRRRGPAPCWPPPTPCTSRSTVAAGTARCRTSPPTRCPVAAEIVLALQAMVTRQFDVFDPVVVTVGRIAAGTTNNVIPSTARARGDGPHLLRGDARGGPRAADPRRRGHRRGARADRDGRLRARVPGHVEHARRGRPRRPAWSAGCSASRPT